MSESPLLSKEDKAKLLALLEIYDTCTLIYALLYQETAGCHCDECVAKYLRAIADEISPRKTLLRQELPEGHETFETTKTLRAAYPDAKLVIDIAEIQMAEALDNLGRAHAFVSHDRQHWWGVVVE